MLFHWTQWKLISWKIFFCFKSYYGAIRRVRFILILSLRTYSSVSVLEETSRFKMAAASRTPRVVRYTVNEDENQIDIEEGLPEASVTFFLFMVNPGCTVTRSSS